MRWGLNCDPRSRRLDDVLRMTQGVNRIQSTMQAAEVLLSEAAAQPAETWSSAQVFRFKTREDAANPHGNGKSKLPIWQVMQELSREMRQGNGRNGRQAAQDLSRQDEPLAERWKLQSEGLSSQVASLRAQLAESRRNQECLQNDLYESMRREASLKAKLAAADSKLDAVERWAQVMGQHMEEEVSRNFLESDKRQLQNLTECLALAVKSMSLFVGLMDKDSMGQLQYTFVHNQKQFFGDAVSFNCLPACWQTSCRDSPTYQAVKQEEDQKGYTSVGRFVFCCQFVCSQGICFRLA